MDRSIRGQLIALALFQALGVAALLFLGTPMLNLFQVLLEPGIWRSLFLPDSVAAARTSFMTATIATLLAALFGIPLAYILGRKRFPGKALAEILVLLPLTLPPVVGGVLLLLLYGPRAPVGRLAAAFDWHLTGTAWGIIIAQVFVSSPFLIMAAKTAFESVDPTLEKASLTLGRGPWETWWRVTLPLASRGIAAGAVLTWARAVGEFGATMIMAYHPHTLPVTIWVKFAATGFRGTLPAVIVLLGLALLVLIAARRLTGALNHD